jgi:MHS family proline/betaine transporter-like MFS transporter
MMGSLNGALSYTLFGFLNIYLSRYVEIPLVMAMQMNLLGLFAFMIGSPIMGCLLDSIGQKRFLASAIGGIMVLAIPIFIALSTSSVAPIMIGQVLLGLCTASIAGSGHAVMQTLFSVNDRYSGIAFNFSLGMGLIGGMTPMIYVSMIETHQMSLLFPAYYLMGLTLLFGFSLLKIPAFQKTAKHYPIPNRR